MKTRQVMTVVGIVGCLFFLSPSFAAGPVPGGDPGDKSLVTDGHVVHDLGNLHNHVTNFGLIGSWPTRPTDFSHAPSARWGGEDYLWGAGLWVGGTVLGEPLVTTGQFTMEFQSTEAPGDTLFPMAHGAVGGARYPWPMPDDDGDGAEDEDPLDGLDNDLDGLIDEDFAAAGDQSFRCTMADNLAEIVEAYPDHTPMNLQIVQESYQWDDPLTADFIGYEYRITNVGVTAIEGFHCGIFADFDIGERPDDDLAGSWHGGLVRISDGSFVPVSMGWMRDAATLNPVPGWAGFVMCGVETDAAAGLSGDLLDLYSMNIFSGQESFENGGDPTNDSERYKLLSSAGHDPNVPASAIDDYRILTSGPEVSVLAPGETVVFRVALVLGASHIEMLTHAAEAVVTAYGQFFDRDGDPANGDEFHVPWLRSDDIPVPAVTGRLQVLPRVGAVSLAFDVPHPGGLGVTIGRRATLGVHARSWPVSGLSGQITDGDETGWPRTYDLKLAPDHGPDLVLDTVQVDRPPSVPMTLDAFPNPFNPRLTIRYALPEAGSARLEILDLRGRVVRVLFDGYQPAGEGRIDWNGQDEKGQAAASGVYLVRLVTSQGMTHQQVTLVR